MPPSARHWGVSMTTEDLHVGVVLIKFTLLSVCERTVLLCANYEVLRPHCFVFYSIRTRVISTFVSYCAPGDNTELKFVLLRLMRFEILWVA